ncbi:MAG: 50S ribosomal protein L25/general stress protein Ctc [Myxococcales bacterium]|nr:50S ribosomal protein L25/general stress protein Ctc [Myxococcales bacterium]
MGEHVLQAETRDEIGKGIARRLRRAGKIPAVFYGRGRDSRAIAIDPRALERVLHTSGSGMNTLIDLTLSGDESVVLVKDLQRDPVRGAYLHADFYEVDLNQTVEVTVPIHFLGKAKGVEFGGIVDHPLREIEITCLPRAIPDSIEIDISALEIGDALHVSDLVAPAGVTITSDLEQAIANVMTPIVEEAPAEEEGVVTEEGEAAAEGGASDEKSEDESD